MHDRLVLTITWGEVLSNFMITMGTVFEVPCFEGAILIVGGLVYSNLVQPSCTAIACSPEAYLTSW